MSRGYSPVRKLAATDQADAFDCGQTALNQFVQRYHRRFGFGAAPDNPLLLFLSAQAEGEGRPKGGPA